MVLKVKTVETTERALTLEEMAMRDVMNDGTYNDTYREAIRHKLCDILGLSDIIVSPDSEDPLKIVGRFSKISSRRATAVEEISYRYLQMNDACRRDDLQCGPMCPFSKGCILSSANLDKCRSIVKNVEFFEED